MGAAARVDAISDAARRHPAYSDAARSALKRFASDESGATAIEYALIAGFVSILIVGAVTSLGTTLKGFFNSVVGSV
jgi:pilus assembly protein Flp/PilA